ncbi:helix-turn-helix domain-containing protein [Virgibacillus doumboii]|uniref:helix-turn-helix domain-containing protein n=1 Tax=Virgibacillus doumboii TaxID=2697503 RepID=UPI0013DF3974|nr:helix-turn-helix transcriptional regulator [Virgibacillus doumboii]
MDTKRLGRRIKAFRKLKGYTQVELAEELEVPIITLGDVERGKQRASNELLEQIAVTLSISKQEILAGETVHEE